VVEPARTPDLMSGSRPWIWATFLSLFCEGEWVHCVLQKLQNLEISQRDWEGGAGPTLHGQTFHKILNVPSFWLRDRRARWLG
jgi:hypothetical protein